MSSQDQSKSKKSQSGTSLTLYPILLILLFVSVIGGIIFLLKDRIIKALEKSHNGTQSESPISPTEPVNDEVPEEKTSDEEAPETAKDVETFVAPESIPDSDRVTR